MALAKRTFLLLGGTQDQREDLEKKIKDEKGNVVFKYSTKATHVLCLDDKVQFLKDFRKAKKEKMTLIVPEYVDACIDFHAWSKKKEDRKKLSMDSDKDENDKTLEKDELNDSELKDSELKDDKDLKDFEKDELNDSGLKEDEKNDEKNEKNDKELEKDLEKNDMELEEKDIDFDLKEKNDNELKEPEKKRPNKKDYLYVVETKVISDLLKGWKIFISGKFSKPLEYFVQIIEEHSGTVMESLGDKEKIVSHILLGTEHDKKIKKKAKDLNALIINEDFLFNTIEEEDQKSERYGVKSSTQSTTT